MCLSAAGKARGLRVFDDESVCTARTNVCGAQGTAFRRGQSMFLC